MTDLDEQAGAEPAEDGAAGRQSAADPVPVQNRPGTPDRRPQPRLRAAFEERAGLAATIARREGARFVQRLEQPWRYIGAWRTPSAERLLIAPQDIRTADPTVAADIYAGHLVFGGAFVDAHGQSPFDLDPPSDAWAEGLHGFGWLRHLRAANSSLSRANARALVEDWIAHSESSSAHVAWRPAVVARRLLSWLAQSPLILSPPDAAFYRRFMRSVGRQVAFLRRAVASGTHGESRLLVAIALAEVGLCAEGLAAARKQGSRVLQHELDRQIFADGGHISRNPGMLVELLLDLLPLRQAYAARSAPVPPPLLNAIDRMIPMIRLFRHGDGTLALFNGMEVTEPDALATVLTYDDVRARPLANAPHAGYQRLEAAGTVVICDTGRPPPAPFDSRAHAGTLSFEVSVGTQRLFVNCGRPETRSREAAQAARSTAAHSTLVIEDLSSSRFASPTLERWFDHGIVAGPRHVPVTRSDDAGTLTITASHDGYFGRFGLLHVRRLVLDRGGGAVLGEDRIQSSGSAPDPAPVRFALRFHLHPAVRPQLVQGGTAVLLTLPSDERWLFDADRGSVAVEESILFAAPPGARATQQIVVEAGHPEVNAIHWSLARLSTRPA